MKPWDTFLPLVLPYCPGCPDLVAEDEIRNAAEDFFARSFAWRHDTAEIDTVGGQSEYVPVLPENTRMVRLYGGSLDGTALELTGDNPVGAPSVIYTNDLDTIGLLPAPGAAGQKIVANVALTVTSAATSIGNALYDLHKQAIADGAIARIAERPSAPYANPDQALQRWARFEAAIRRARSEKQHSHTTAPKRVVAQFM